MLWCILLISAVVGTTNSFTLSVQYHRQEGLQMTFQSMEIDEIRETSDMNVLPSSTTTTLAGPYLVSCSHDNNEKYTWSLTPVEAISAVIDKEAYSSQGAQAWAALHIDGTNTSTTKGKELSNSASTILTAEFKRDQPCHLSISCSHEFDSNNDFLGKDEQELIAVLSRILAQWAISNHLRNEPNNSQWFVQLPDQSKLLSLSQSDITNDDIIRTVLFEPMLLEQSESSEIVECVDGAGALLGRVPRKLVHAHNLLHRGIGLFVTKNNPIKLKQPQQPDLYVHRRTSTKRIFPSLYDMFVGGVSLAGESAVTTAQREVAEELGLFVPEHLSKEPILQCVVCTAYNRCVVDLFSYSMDTTQEQVSWQEEEVSWGSFVPYAIIEAAADKSILRLSERGEWPGRNPPIQSQCKGNTPGNEGFDITSSNHKDWQAWDFVPDGLLVWEAWLLWLDEQQQS